MDTHKTILILGAGADIAKAIARKFASRDYNIQLAGRNQVQLERLQRDLVSRYEAEVTTHFFDATDFDSHATFISGLPVISGVVVYVAGVMYAQQEAHETWHKAQNMIAVNYSGAVSVLNRFAEIFSDQGKGCIVGISSVAGERGRGSNFIYGSTKAALTTYLSGLRNELFKKGVQVITVKPGFVYTKMTRELTLPARLTVQPDRVADAIYQAVTKKRDVIYVKPIWRVIMQVIRILPEAVFKRTKL